MTKPRMWFVVLFVACLPAFAQAKSPNFSGTWLVIPERSHAERSDLKFSVVEIRQDGPQIRFDYFHGEKLLGTEIFVAGAPAAERYKTRVETASAKAVFRNNALVISTVHMQANFVGDASFTETESWTLSPDGKTLTHKLSDGHVVVYEKRRAAGGGPP